MDIKRPGYPGRIPAVLTSSEVAAVLGALEGETALLARLLYGTGMRLMEGLRLRVKDVDFERAAIIVRDAKGGKDRVVMLPQSLEHDMRAQMLASRVLWKGDRWTCSVAASMCRMRSKPKRTSSSPSQFIRFGIVSLRTCSRPARTSAPCKSYSVTATSALR